MHYPIKDISDTGSSTRLLSFVSFIYLGFRLSPQAINGIVKRYSCRGKISFDDYIACCVKLRALTGMINFTAITELDWFLISLFIKLSFFF